MVLASLSVRLHGVDFENCLLNASGPKDTTLDELRTIAQSRSAAIVSKTTTFLPRAGNPEPRYFDLQQGSINSMGLPNPGYQEMAVRCKQIHAEFPNKPVIASMSGFNAEESRAIAAEFNGTGVSALEVNLSCPNLKGKPQVCFDSQASRAILEAVKDVTKLPIMVKVSPFLDGVMQDNMSTLLEEMRVDAVIAINSPGNTLAINERNEMVIKPKWGGLGGEYIKYIALGNVRRYYEFFKGKIPVVGCGGVYTGRDAFEHVLAGASAVSIGTAFHQHGAPIFEKVERELSALLDAQGFASVEDAVGKAKEIA